MAASSSEAYSGVQSRSFGKLSDGSEVTLYTLTSAAGVVVEVMSYGGVRRRTSSACCSAWAVLCL
jgi:hypothetical protein